MTSIGQSDEVERTRGSLSDRMLSEWCRYRLRPPVDREKTNSSSNRSLPLGTVFRAGVPSSRALLKDQYLHKSLFMTVSDLPDGRIMTVVLNRPTSRRLQFQSQGRYIIYGGNIPGKVLWLGRKATLDSVELGSDLGKSGLKLVLADEGANAVLSGKLKFRDFLLVRGFTIFKKEEIVSMLEDEELQIIEDPSPLWPQVFELANVISFGDDDDEGLLSDGVGVWWAAGQLEKAMRVPQQGDAEFELEALPPPHLADEALADWLYFMAGHERPLKKSE